MRRGWLAVVVSLALLATARAEEPQGAEVIAAPEVLTPLTEHLGYALGQPTTLLRQRLFGLAHGLSLLAAACLDLPTHALAVENAYAEWHQKQAATIETLFRALATYHFGPRADEAQWGDLAGALNLKESIQPSLSGVALSEACRTLPEAMTRPRFALDHLLTGTDDSALAVVPAPTLEPTDK